MAIIESLILKRDLQICFLAILFLAGCRGNKKDGEKQQTRDKTAVNL